MGASSKLLKSWGRGGAQLLLDPLTGEGGFERGNLVLQHAQLGDPLGREEVRTGAHGLPELDEGRAEVDEGGAQPRGRVEVLIGGVGVLVERAQVDDVVQVETFDDVAETMAYQDGNDGT